jgi:Ca2+-binding RTX toxin-like protein
MATILFPSNNDSIQGTPGDDSMVGNDPRGNINDIIYGHQGNDTITTQHGLFDSTVYGGQGNDSIFDGNPTPSGTSGGNVIYGNFGNDSIFVGQDDSMSAGSEFDTIYGGQGNDTVTADFTTANVIYGNLGNDLITTIADGFDTLYGGQGNDTVNAVDANRDVIYGNFGNDLLIGNDGTSNTHEYGGQGNDTLVFTGTDSDHPTVNDTMTGNLGNDLFIATNDAGTGPNPHPGPGPGPSGFPISADDIVTVTDFLSGTDQLAMTRDAGITLVKIQGIGDNAAQALNDANAIFSGGPHPGPGGPVSEYVFVYGGMGAGYLFYNGDIPQTAATAGMALVGQNGENSVMASDITLIPNNVPFA